MNLEQTARVLDVLTEQLSDLIGSQDRKLDRLVGDRAELSEVEPQREYYGVLGGIEQQLEIICKQVGRLEALNRGLEQALFQQEEEALCQRPTSVVTKYN